MKLSDEGLTQIAQNEGFAPKLYFDHKGYSIGYGHLCSQQEVALFTGKTISEELAKELLHQDAAKAELYVSDTIKVPLTQQQFDALVDFTYNMGVGSLANIAQTLNTGDYAAAAARMRLYDKVRVRGQLAVSPALTARRKQEVKAFGAL
jgi:GH24 family phage-related lysozyme (muramidase)